MKTSKFNINNHKEHLTGKFSVQISDGPSSGLIRVIDYHGATISHNYKIIEHNATMRYFNQKGEYIPRFSHKVKQRGRDWLVDNTYEVIVRDESGKPKIGDDNNPVKSPAYDYFIEILFNAPLPLSEILIASIKIDDMNQLYEE